MGGAVRRAAPVLGGPARTSRRIGDSRREPNNAGMRRETKLETRDGAATSSTAVTTSAACTR